MAPVGLMRLPGLGSRDPVKTLLKTVNEEEPCSNQGRSCLRNLAWSGQLFGLLDRS